MIQFILNNKKITSALPAGTVLLDFVRYQQHLTGTKIGCREGDCGACTVLVGELKNDEVAYRSFTSCLTPIGNVQGKHVVTVEGVNTAGLNPIQAAMVEASATQCGFCTPGFVMSLAGFCLSSKEPTTANAIAAIDGNICRCTGYKSIERAAATVAARLQDRKGTAPATFATAQQLLPSYFATIKEQLLALVPGTESAVESPAAEKKFVGGGTDLYVQQHEVMAGAAVGTYTNMPALKGIRKAGTQCIMGGAVTVTEFGESEVIQEHFPDLQQYLRLVSSTPIRNMATVAGNFINASPIGDFTIMFLALDATLVLRSGEQVRELPLRELYLGYKSLAKEPEEYVQNISFELPGENTRFHFEKVSKRTHLDIASVNTAVCLTVEDNIITAAGIAAGGVGPVPAYLAKASFHLKGKAYNEQLLHEMLEIAQAEISPISDARGSETYKRLLLQQLLIAHFQTLFP